MSEKQFQGLFALVVSNKYFLIKEMKAYQQQIPMSKVELPPDPRFSPNIGKKTTTNVYQNELVVVDESKEQQLLGQSIQSLKSQQKEFSKNDKKEVHETTTRRDISSVVIIRAKKKSNEKRIRAGSGAKKTSAIKKAWNREGAEIVGFLTGVFLGIFSLFFCLLKDRVKFKQGLKIGACIGIVSQIVLIVLIVLERFWIKLSIFIFNYYKF